MEYKNSGGQWASLGGSGEAKKLVEDFVVGAGENITAGDVVSYVNGYAKKGYQAGSGFDKGSETEINDSVMMGAVNYISSAKLSATTFVVAYQDSTNSNYGAAVIGTVSGNTITWGNEYVFNSANSDYASVTALDSTHFAVAYRDRGNSEYGTIVIGTVSGSIISYGSEYVFNYAQVLYISITTLDSTHVAIAYRDGGNENYGTAIIGTVSGSAVSYGSEYVFNSSSTNSTFIAALDSTHVAISYRDDGHSNYGTAIIGTVSGSTISYGSEYVFNTAQTEYISIAVLDSTHFAVAYADSGNSSHGTAIIGTVSGTAISYGSEYDINPGQSDFVSIATLDSTHFAMAYRDGGNSYYGTTIICNVSGSSISYGSEYVFNSGQSNYTAIAALDSTHFAVAYRDDGNLGYGTAIVGTVSGSTISYGSEYIFNLTANLSYLSSAKMDATHFIVAYQDSNGNGVAKIGTVADKAVAWGSEYAFDSAPYANYISVTALDSTHFAVAYQDQGNSSYGTAIIGTVSGSTISYGSEYVFNNSGTTSYISATTLDSTHFVVAYLDNGINQGTAVIGTISGTAISYGSEYIYQASVSTYNAITTIDSTHFAVGCVSATYSANTYIGTVSGSDITYSGSYVLENNAASTESISYLDLKILDSTHVLAVYRDGGSESFGTARVGIIAGNAIDWGDKYVFNSGYTQFSSIAVLDSTGFAIAYQDGGNLGKGTVIIGKIYGDTINWKSSEDVWFDQSVSYNSLISLSSTEIAFSTKVSDQGYTRIGDFLEQSNVIGIAQESKTDGETIKVATQGSSDVHSGLTVGEKYYAQEDGSLTTTFGPFLQPVGLAISSTTLLLNQNDGNQYFGDMVFANNFRITEDWSNPQGLIFKNQNGLDVMHLDELGILSLTGAVKAPKLQIGENSLFAGSNGFVGIGTTSPTSKLEVADGDIKITNGSLIINNLNVNEALGKISNDQLSIFNQLSISNDQISKLTENQNLIARELTSQLADQTLSINDKLTLIGQNLTDLQQKEADIKDLQEQFDALTQETRSIASLQEAMKDLNPSNLALLNNINTDALISLTASLNTNLMIYKDAIGNVDLGTGNLMAQEVHAQAAVFTGKITASDIDLTGNLTAKDITASGTVAGAAIQVGNQASGKGMIKAGDTEVLIGTPYASASAKISITPEGDTFGRILFYEEIQEGQSFKVKIKSAATEGDIHFDWFIIK